jgi:predicted ATPase/Tfp pilus assembly protein PilF
MDPSPPRPAPVPAWPDAAPPDTARWPLIGRDELVGKLVRDLTGEPRRAFVLGGLGGVGKTRLAAEVARGVAERVDGRVAWISVASAPRDAGLAMAIATGFGLSDREPDQLAEALAEAIGDAPALLVLDGAEARLHDLGLIDELLELAQPLRLLLTSRVAVARSGIVAIPIGTLAVPAPGADPEQVSASPAVVLLVDRAARAGADATVTVASATAITRLVTRLDGLPLAIEVAAPLLRTLPPHRLLERIGDRLDPIVATLDWSYDQLEPDDRRLYRRLAVFGVPFRARHVRTFAERAISHGLSPLGPDIADALDRLAAASLIRVRPDPQGLDPASGPDDPRGSDVLEFELPALIRDDATRRLQASGEATAAFWARANDLLALCELSHAELEVRSRLDLLDQLDIVHADVIASLERARASGEGDFLIRMTGALSEYWRARGRLSEGRVWLDAALRLGSLDPTAERARALHGAGMLANWQSDFERGRRLLDEALAIRLQIGAEADAAATLNQLGLIALDLGDLDEAERHCRRGLAIRRNLGDDATVAASLNTLGGVLQFSGRTDEAGAAFEESLAIRRRLGDESGSSVSLGNLGLVARDRGDLEAAESMFREAIATRERLADRQRVAVVRHNLALVLFDRGDLTAARADLELALGTARELGDRLETSNALSDLGFVERSAGNLDRSGGLQLEALAVAARIGAKGIVAQSIDGVAGLVAADDRLAEAATLWAAAARIRHEARFHLLEADRRRIDREIAAARNRIDDATWQRAWEVGEQLPIDAAIARARAALESPLPAPRAAGRVAV